MAIGRSLPEAEDDKTEIALKRLEGKLESGNKVKVIVPFIKKYESYDIKDNLLDFSNTSKYELLIRDYLFIDRNSPIDKGINYGEGPREAIVVDFDKDVHIKKFYKAVKDEVKKKTSGLSDGFIKNFFILRTVFKMVRKTLMENFDPKFINHLSDVYPDFPLPLGFFISIGNGVCRHMALLNGVVIERLIKDDLIKGSDIKVVVNRNKNVIPGHGCVGGHAWCRFEQARDVFIIDSMQNYFGLKVKQKNGSDDYFVIDLKDSFKLRDSMIVLFNGEFQKERLNTISKSDSSILRYLLKAVYDYSFKKPINFKDCIVKDIILLKNVIGVIKKFNKAILSEKGVYGISKKDVIKTKEQFLDLLIYQLINSNMLRGKLKTYSLNRKRKGEDYVFLLEQNNLKLLVDPFMNDVFLMDEKDLFRVKVDENKSNWNYAISGK